MLQQAPVIENDELNTMLQTDRKVIDALKDAIYCKTKSEKLAKQVDNANVRINKLANDIVEYRFKDMMVYTNQY